eukprot:SAG31_NODE_14162_length_824_cov_1.002759_2_plen_25_part_01
MGVGYWLLDSNPAIYVSLMYRILKS